MDPMLAGARVTRHRRIPVIAPKRSARCLRDLTSSVRNAPAGADDD
jgi:hypothetical protein